MHWTHTKTAESIKVPFGLMTWVGPIGTIVRYRTRSPKDNGQLLLSENVAVHCKVMTLYGALCKND